MKIIAKILIFIGDNPFWIMILLGLLAWIAADSFSKKNLINLTEENQKTLTDKYYIREVRYNADATFEVPQTDTIIILDQKNGFVKWSFIHSYGFDSTFYLSKYEYLIERIKPLKNK